MVSSDDGNGMALLDEDSKKLFECLAGLSGVCCCCFCSCGRPCWCMVVVGQRRCGPQGERLIVSLRR